MINRIWIGLIVIGIVISFFTGQINNLGDVILKSSNDALTIFIKVGLMIIFWNGIFKIAIDSGLIKHLSTVFKRPLKWLFPELSLDSKALEYMASNIIANLLGLGSASTPLGLKAFQELQKENPTKDTATRSMVTFILINTTSLTLFPTAIFSLRSLYLAKTNIDVIILMILITILTTIIALVLDRIFYLLEKRKNS